MRHVPALRIGALALLLALVASSLSVPLAGAAIAPGTKAVVATTEGDLLSLRSGPGVSFPLSIAMPQGLEVDVLSGPETSADGAAWYQVRAGEVTGWAAAEYLAEPQATAPPATSSPPAAAPTSLMVGGTDGSGARLRDVPGLASVVLSTIADGQVVEVTGTATSADGYDWAPVTYNQLSGWVATSFLLATSHTNPPSAAPVDPPAPAATPPVATPKPAPVASPPPTVTVPPAAAPYPAGPAPDSASLDPGNHASVVNTDGLDLRIRAGAGVTNAILDYAPAGAVLLVTQAAKQDAQGGVWYGIDYDGTQGWVSGLFVTVTDAPTTRRGATTPTAGPATLPVSQSPPAPASPGATTPATTPVPPARTNPTPAPALAPPAGRGKAIANTALKYVGVVKYSWGGTTTAGWDCSGMVGYVYSEATGQVLPRTTQDQFAVGKPVAANDVQAGDIVFFSNTNGPGITHNGIAIGDGSFVHARSENTGTVISSLTDAYWSAHFAGARRP